MAKGKRSSNGGYECQTARRYKGRHARTLLVDALMKTQESCHLRKLPVMTHSTDRQRPRKVGGKSAFKTSVKGKGLTFWRE